MSENPRWSRRPEGSNWGDFGPDDQLGRLNLITAQKVREGVAEAREGLVFCLSLPLDYPGGNVLAARRYPPVLHPTARDGRPNFNFVSVADGYTATDIVSDDLVVLHLQYSTQWDSLAHVGAVFDADGDGEAERVYYNGYRAGEHVVAPDDVEGVSCAHALGIENMAVAGVQGRAVMIDLHAHFGDAKTLVGYDELMRVVDADKVVVETGDMVCLRTGFDEVVLSMDREPTARRLHNSCAALNGRDPRLLNWITDTGLSVLISDNFAVEALPAKGGEGCCASLPLHEHCLFKLGIHLGELWRLSPLANWLREHGRSRFLLTAPPLRLPGAVGSPATPVATV